MLREKTSVGASRANAPRSRESGVACGLLKASSSGSPSRAPREGGVSGATATGVVAYSRAASIEGVCAAAPVALAISAAKRAHIDKSAPRRLPPPTSIFRSPPREQNNRYATLRLYEAVKRHDCVKQ